MDLHTDERRLAQAGENTGMWYILLSGANYG